MNVARENNIHDQLYETLRTSISNKQNNMIFTTNKFL